MAYRPMSIAPADTAAEFKPHLTSLVDVMTILVVFLIKSFSVEGHIVTPSAGLNLPVSASTEKPQSAAVIEISQNAVLSDGEIIASLESFSSADSLTIPALYRWLLSPGAGMGGDSQGHTLQIQADRELEFNIMKRVMYTCSKAGFDDFSILVMNEE